MSALREFKVRARAVAGPMLITLVVSYFVYHVVQGEHGLISYYKLRTQVADAEHLAIGLSHEREDLDRRTQMLRRDQLDLDLLEETVRQHLHLTHPDEIVILID